jgi:hypothetical protein
VSTENFTKDDWILVGIAALLVIDLLFLPWFSITIGPFTVTATATSDPDGWLGVLSVLTSILLIADVALERMSPQTRVPALRGSRTETRFVLACAAAAFVALKFLFHIHFDLFGIGFWAGIILSAGLVYVASRARTAGASRY